MAQEFTINSSAIESKINQLLPSQGGFGAGVDFSASTMVIPIVDLTETAEGSDVRPDLQTSISFNTATNFQVNNATTTIINTTGYYRVFGVFNGVGGQDMQFILNDGASTKTIANYAPPAGTTIVIAPFDFNVFLKAGDFLQLTVSAGANAGGCTRQIADISGNLTNP